MTTKSIVSTLSLMGLFSCLLLFSCNRQAADSIQTVPQIPEEWSEYAPGEVMASFRRTACFGQCPVFTVTFFANGTAMYKGDMHVDKLGRHIAGYPTDRLQEIIDFAEENGFFEMADTYPEDKRFVIADASHTITQLRSGEKTHRINRNSLGPDELREIENKLQELVESLVLAGIDIE